MVLIATLFAAGCGEGNGGTTSRLNLTACTTIQGAPARCGQLAVPENPAAPNGRKISLNVVVLPARSLDRAADPLFYFAGGPGGAATAAASWFYNNFALLNQRRDIVMIDQRGTGGSNQLTCSLGYTALTDAAIAVGVDGCLTSIKAKADPLMYTTPFSVDDFDHVRAALGYDKVDVFAVSYGVTVGLDYIQRHGDHVRSAVLDSGSLLDVHLWERVPVSAQHSLDELFARCGSDQACAAAFPDFKADFGTITGRLAAGPATIDVINPASGKKATVSVDLPTFLNFVIDGYLSDMRSAAALPKAVHAAAHGDWTDFVQAYAAANADSPTQIMSLSIVCSDAWATYNPSTIAAIGVGSAFTPGTMRRANFFNTECKYWPHAEGASGPVYSSAPIVFLNGTADPADPPDNVAGAIATMPNSLVVPVTGFAHSVINQDSTSCLTDKATTFIELGQRSILSNWSCPNLLPSFVTQ